MRIPQNGWFTMEIPIKVDDLGASRYPHLWMPPFNGAMEENSISKCFKYYLQMGFIAKLNHQRVNDIHVPTRRENWSFYLFL